MERNVVNVHILDEKNSKLLSYYTTENFSETLKAFHYMKYNDDITISIDVDNDDIDEKEGCVTDVTVTCGSKDLLTSINVYVKVY